MPHTHGDKPVQSSQFKSTSPAAPQLAPDEDGARKGRRTIIMLCSLRRLSIFNASFPVLACQPACPLPLAHNLEVS